MKVLNNIVLGLFTLLIVIYLVNFKFFTSTNCEGFKEGKDDEDDLNLTEKVFKHSGEISMLKEHVDKILEVRQEMANLRNDVDINKTQISSLVQEKQGDMNKLVDEL